MRPVREFAGYSTSVIACDAEIGVERSLPADETPDGRPGNAILVFGFSADCAGRGGAQSGRPVPDDLSHHAPFTTGCRRARHGFRWASTCVSSATGIKRASSSAGRRYWRIPVMDGEFLVEDTLRVDKGVAGGNIILQADHACAALGRGPACQRGNRSAAGRDHAVSRRRGPQRQQSRLALQEAARLRPPTLIARPCAAASKPGLPTAANYAYEIVIDGMDEPHVAPAMCRGDPGCGRSRGAGHQRRQLWRQARQVSLSPL